MLTSYWRLPSAVISEMARLAKSLEDQLHENKHKSAGFIYLVYLYRYVCGHAFFFFPTMCCEREQRVMLQDSREIVCLDTISIQDTTGKVLISNTLELTTELT